MSLWRMEDEGTQDLMVRYYENLLDGMGRSEALRHAKSHLLRRANDTLLRQVNDTLLRQGSDTFPRHLNDVLRQVNDT